MAKEGRLVPKTGAGLNREMGVERAYPVTLQASLERARFKEAREADWSERASER